MIKNKLFLAFSIFFFITSITYAFELLLTPSYSYTLNSTGDTNTQQSLDYTGGRISFLIPTQDSEEISYGPYLGFFYNHQLLENLQNLEDVGISLGLNMKYTTNIIGNLNFLVTAFGGVHTEDYFKTFKTEILINGGVSYNNLSLSVGYETRYYEEELTVNYLPISLGVSFKF
jgi:hypothetical protein